MKALAVMDVLLLDKTGTITLGSRQAARVHPRSTAQTGPEVADAAQLANLTDGAPGVIASWCWRRELFDIRARVLEGSGA